MCVALYAPAKGKLISLTDFKLMRSDNPDGMGMMWSENGKLHIVRRRRRLGRFWQQYRSLHEQGKDVVVHFRLATHGTTGVENVHPVQVNEQLAFVHNGVLFGYSDADERSDTRQFSDTVLRHLPSDWYKRNDSWEWVSYLTTGSRLIFLDAEGVVKIMHEKMGDWIGGNWYSNTWFKWPVTFGYSGYTDSCAIKYNDRRSSSNLETTVPKWSRAYIHWPTHNVVCNDCRWGRFGGEPNFHFNPLWDDEEPIVCDHCEVWVNRKGGPAKWSETAGEFALVDGAGGVGEQTT